MSAVSHITVLPEPYRTRYAEEISKLDTGELSDGMASEIAALVSTTTLEEFRRKIRSASTSILVVTLSDPDFQIEHISDIDDPSGDLFSEIDTALIGIAVLAAVATELDRRIPIPGETR